MKVLKSLLRASFLMLTLMFFANTSYGQSSKIPDYQSSDYQLEIQNLDTDLQLEVLEKFDSFSNAALFRLKKISDVKDAARTPRQEEIYKLALEKWIDTHLSLN